MRSPRKDGFIGGILPLWRILRVFAGKFPAGMPEGGAEVARLPLGGEKPKAEEVFAELDNSRGDNVIMPAIMPMKRAILFVLAALGGLLVGGGGAADLRIGFSGGGGQLRRFLPPTADSPVFGG